MIIELQKAFSFFKYSDKYHQYFTNDGQELTSITRLIDRLKPKFDSKFWSMYKSYQASGCTVKMKWYKDSNDKWQTSKDAFIADGVTINLNDNHSHLPVTPEMMAAQWHLDSLIGKTRGSFAHKYLENLENRISDKPEIIMPAGLSTPQAINFIRSIEVVEKLCLQFMEDFKHLIPVAIEYKVADLEMELAGTFDRLYYNEITEELEIWDFKTDKKIKTSSQYEKIKIFNVDDCELQKYSIQTSFYKRIIEKNTNLRLGQSNIAHLNLKDERMDIYKCTDYCDFISTVNDWHNIN